MSKVKLRSRCYKLSKAETDNLSTQNHSKHNLRSNYGKCKKKILSQELEDVMITKLDVDKSLDNCAIETSSMESQSTSQMSSGISLESLDFCKWQGCVHDFISYDNHLCNQPRTVISDELEKHLLEYHVKSQLTSKRKYFQCLWSGCKVYKQRSLSYSWLERHVIDHTENRNRPFSCIFDCHLRFASQLLLEKHVQTHIDALNENGIEESMNITSENYENLRIKKPIPINRRTSKHLHSYHVHRPDFINFNNFIQIQTKNNLQKMNISADLLDGVDLQCLKNKSPPKDLIRLLSLEFKVMGKRTCVGCRNQILVEWIHPYNTRTQAEWIDESLLQLAESLSQKLGTH